MKLKTEMRLNYPNNTVRFEVDDGHGKLVVIDLFTLIEENYGAKNARAIVGKILENEQDWQSTVDLMDEENNYLDNMCEWN